MEAAGGKEGVASELGEVRTEQEVTFLQKMFPEEIWLLTLEQVKDPTGQELDNFEDISNASQYFRTLLLSTRVLFLFPKVFGILAFHAEEYSLTPTNQESQLIKWTVIFRQNILLRLTCSQWRHGVDHYYSQHPSHFAVNSSLQNLSSGQRSLVYFPYQKIRDLHSQFLSHFEASHLDSQALGNPFISRAVGFNDNCKPSYADNVRLWPYNEQHPLPFYSGISSILMSYGHHLHHCEFSLEDRFPTLAASYRKLQEWLSLLPCLRTLRILHSRQKASQIAEDPFQMFRPLSEIRSGSPPPEYLSLLEEIRDNPLPVLKDLQLLQTEGLPTPISNELLHRNPHVSGLHVTGKSVSWTPSGFEDLTSSDIYTESLPNLKTFSIRFGSSIDIRAFLEANTTWQLNALHLYWTYYDPVQWSSIFDRISQKWSESLQQVSLNLPPPRYDNQGRLVGEDFAETILNVPGIRKLKVVLGSRLPIDFIWPCRNALEHLEIEVNLQKTVGDPTNVEENEEQVEEWKRKENIDFLKCLQNMEDSNIWKIFPKMKTLQVKWSDCVLMPNARGINYSSRHEFETRKVVKVRNTGILVKLVKTNVNVNELKKSTQIVNQKLSRI